MSLVGGDLSPRQEENVVKVGLQFAFGVVVRLGVVVGNGDKVERSLSIRTVAEVHWQSIPDGVVPSHCADKAIPTARA